MREGLENRRGGNSTVGSNPTPSARKLTAFVRNRSLTH